MLKTGNVSISGVIFVLWIRSLSRHRTESGGSSFMAIRKTGVCPPQSGGARVQDIRRFCGLHMTHLGPRHSDLAPHGRDLVLRSTSNGPEQG